MKLLLPSERYKESYIEALSAYHEEGLLVDKNLDKISANFTHFIETELSQSEGKNLPEGYVPQTTLWLIDHEEYIGTVRIRHELNEYLKKIGGHIGYEIKPAERRKGYGSEILRRSLPHAKELGLERVLLTCDSTNLGSRKIIEANGGVFEKEAQIKEAGPSTLYFWINT